MKQIAVYMLILFLVSGPLNADTITDKKTEITKTYTLFASGDTMLARWVHYDYYKKGPKKALLGVRDLISGADIALTNLENVISTRGQFWDKGERRPYLYRGRPELFDILTHVGFDLVVMGNNHAMDYGPEALLEQMEIIEAIGMAQVGAGANLEEAAQPTYLQVDDVIVAFIGLLDMLPKFSATADRAGVHYVEGNDAILAAMKEPIAQARKHADVVVFSPHWGSNWTENPSGDRIPLAHKLIDMGVDAILGHSSHHLHGVEIYKGKPIVYDMGSFFFDTVGQSRMRYSAGFLLDFDKQGFRRLSIHPVRLRANKSELAQGGDLKKIQKLIKDMSEKLSPGLEWTTEEGGALTLDFSPETPLPGRQATPEKLYQTGRTTTLPSHIRKRKTNVVLDSPPPWAKGFEPVEMEHGVTIIGARSSDGVWPRRAFKTEVVLKVSGPLKNGNWGATVKGVRRGGGGEFTWRHPIADGGWLANLWEKDQIVVDRTLVRPTKVKQGVYDLYWRLENMSKRSWAKPIGSTNPKDDGFVPIGEIRITKKGIPSGAAGVAWDGWLPGNPEFDQAKFNARMGKEPLLSPLLLQTIVQVSTILLFLILIVGIRLVRKKR